MVIINKEGCQYQLIALFLFWSIYKC